MNRINIPFPCELLINKFKITCNLQVIYLLEDGDYVCKGYKG